MVSKSHGKAKEYKYSTVDKQLPTRWFSEPKHPSIHLDTTNYKDDTNTNSANTRESTPRYIKLNFNLLPFAITTSNLLFVRHD
jgi:hypothetical protein